MLPSRLLHLDLPEAAQRRKGYDIAESEDNQKNIALFQYLSGPELSIDLGDALGRDAAPEHVVNLFGAGRDDDDVLAAFLELSTGEKRGWLHSTKVKSKLNHFVSLIRSGTHEEFLCYFLQ